MCKIVEENAVESVEAYVGNKPGAGLKLKKKLEPLEGIHEQVSKILGNEKSNGDVSQHEVNGTTNTADVAMEDGEGRSPGVIVLE